MPRYFFHVYEDKDFFRDEEGIEFATIAEARKQAQRLLPDLARDEIPENDDRKTYVVLVVDEENCPIYSATLTYAGLWLAHDRP